MPYLRCFAPKEGRPLPAKVLSLKRARMTIGSKVFPGIVVPLAREAAAASRMVRKYFRIMTQDRPVVAESGRFEGWWDFAEVAVRLMARLENSVEYGMEVVIGSNYLSDYPWAVFGNTRVGARNKFAQFSQIIDHYDKHLSDTNRVEYTIPFNSDGEDVYKMANRHDLSPATMFAACLLLTRDMIYHGGPDCDLFFDLYTNDIRDTPDTIDLDEWEKTRCRMFGRFGEVEFPDPRFVESRGPRQVMGFAQWTPPVTPPKFRKCNVELKLMSAHEPLMAGMEMRHD